MKVSLEFEIGNTTCASEPNKFCRFTQASHLGTRSCCVLFQEVNGDNMPLFDRDGWLERCPACLEAFPPKELG